MWLWGKTFEKDDSASCNRENHMKEALSHGSYGLNPGNGWTQIVSSGHVMMTCHCLTWGEPQAQDPAADLLWLLMLQLYRQLQLEVQPELQPAGHLQKTKGFSLCRFWSRFCEATDAHQGAGWD